MTARSIALFVLAAVAEIGGAYLMWQAIKEDRAGRRLTRARSRSGDVLVGDVRLAAQPLSL